MTVRFRSAAALGLRIVLGLATGAALLAQEPALQTPQARFRARTDLVQVEVTVLDDGRRPVHELTREDFTVFQDGQAQPIEAFTEIRLPDRQETATAPWTYTVPADVATNQITEQEGRLVVVLLDRSIPLGQPTTIARRIALAAIDQLGPGDLAAVVSTSGGATQTLTADRARLRRAVEATDPSSGVSSDSRELEEQLTAGGPFMTWTRMNDGRCLCGLCVLESITRIADAVSVAARRRKVLLFIGSEMAIQSAGTAGQPRNDVGCDSRLRDARGMMFAALGRANMTIHSLDPGGLNVVGPIGRASSPLGMRSVPQVMSRDLVENLQHQDELRVLPDRTGGRTVVNTNGPQEQVPAIFRESESYYLLAFRQAEDEGAKRHAVTVKVRRDGVSVHTRSGYAQAVVPSGPAPASSSMALSESTRAALTGLLPAADVPLDAQVAMFAGPEAGRGALAIVAGIGGFVPAAGTTAPIEVVASAFDRTGRPMGLARQSLEVTGQAVDGRAVMRTEALSRLDLPPGDYQVRIAVTGGAPARSASVFTDVTIPRFDVAPLSLSSLVLAASAGTLTAPKGFLEPLLPLMPTARREFAANDRITAFLRVYQGSSRADALRAVTLRTTVVDGKGQEVATAATVLTADQFARNRSAEHFITVPVAPLGAGDYLLRVEASAGTYSAGRVLRFRMR